MPITAFGGAIVINLNIALFNLFSLSSSAGSRINRLLKHSFIKSYTVALNSNGITFAGIGACSGKPWLCKPVCF